MFLRSSKSKPKKKTPRKKEKPQLTELMDYLCERGYTAYGFDDLSVRVHFPDSQDPLFSLTNDGKKYECLNITPAPIFDTKYDVENFLKNYVKTKPIEFSDDFVKEVSWIMEQRTGKNYNVIRENCMPDSRALYIHGLGDAWSYENGLLYGRTYYTDDQKYLYCSADLLNLIKDMPLGSKDDSGISAETSSSKNRRPRMFSRSRVRTYSDEERLCDLPDDIGSDGMIAVCDYILKNTGKVVSQNDFKKIKEFTILKIRNAGGERYMLDAWLTKYIDSPQEDKWAPKMFYNPKRRQ